MRIVEFSANGGTQPNMAVGSAVMCVEASLSLINTSETVMIAFFKTDIPGKASMPWGAKAR